MNTRTRVTALPAVLAAGGVASLPGVLRTAAAQHDHGSPAAGSSLANPGLPELNLTVTDVVEGVPESLDFVPDPETGMPQARMGMHTLFEVAG